MSTPPPIPLTPVLTFPGKPDYEALLGWPFADDPFYEGQVKRLLQTDIPNRTMNGVSRLCLIYLYRDPEGNTVGFGTLDLCNEYERFTEGKPHTYIPLLAVNPAFQKRGHGFSIVQHLIAEAVLISRSVPAWSEYLFLDVYLTNQRAIALYEKCGFVKLNPDTPFPDPQENNEPYIVMAKNLAIATGQI